LNFERGEFLIKQYEKREDGRGGTSSSSSPHSTENVSFVSDLWCGSRSRWACWRTLLRAARRARRPWPWPDRRPERPRSRGTATSGSAPRKSSRAPCAVPPGPACTSPCTSDCDRCWRPDPPWTTTTVIIIIIIIIIIIMSVIVVNWGEKNLFSQKISRETHRLLSDVLHLRPRSAMKRALAFEFPREFACLRFFFFRSSTGDKNREMTWSRIVALKCYYGWCDKHFFSCHNFLR